MIEEIILNYLSQKINAPCVMQMPEDYSPPFVLIEKVGSSKENHICTASIAVQSYASTLHGAAELNEAVKAAMEDAIELDAICTVDIDSDYNFTDANKKRYRYQSVFDIVHY